MKVIRNVWKRYSRYLPDRIYIGLECKKHSGHFPNLKHPKTFNEKLQWLKLNDHNPDYIRMVDKYEAKEYVAKLIGEKYIVPTLGIWDKFEDIDFDSLPNQFVLKCTHDSASVIIVKEKNKFDFSLAKNKIEECLQTNFFWSGREWPYKNVMPRIIAEKYMVDNEYNGLIDYKIHCFNGVPKFLNISFSEISSEGKKVYYKYLDLKWQDTPFYRICPPEIPFEVKRPKDFDVMIELARKLSKNVPFVRTDFYYIKGQIYFSELTFFPGSGFTTFCPDEWEKEIGEWVKLPNIIKK